MKKLAATAFVALGLFALGAPAASAAPGGAPGLHGVDGRTFGGLVSGLAHMYPGAVADHTSNR
jgi:hypothetical protein